MSFARKTSYLDWNCIPIKSTHSSVTASMHSVDMMDDGVIDMTEENNAHCAAKLKGKATRFNADSF